MSELKKKLPSFLKEEFLRDKANQGMLLVSLSLLLAVWVFSIFSFKVTDFLVPVKYSSFLGVTKVGNWYELYRIPVYLTVATAINLSLANLIYKKDRMITYILVGANIFLGMVSAVLVFNFSRLAGI